MCITAHGAGNRNHTCCQLPMQRLQSCMATEAFCGPTCCVPFNGCMAQQSGCVVTVWLQVQGCCCLPLCLQHAYTLAMLRN